jgi:hypothetical protein
LFFWGQATALHLTAQLRTLGNLPPKQLTVLSETRLDSLIVVLKEFLVAAPSCMGLGLKLAKLVHTYKLLDGLGRHIKDQRQFGVTAMAGLIGFDYSAM